MLNHCQAKVKLTPTSQDSDVFENRTGCYQFPKKQNGLLAILCKSDGMLAIQDLLKRNNNTSVDKVECGTQLVFSDAEVLQNNMFEIVVQNHLISNTESRTRKHAFVV